MKEIFINEIKNIIGHTPSDDEFVSAMDYLADKLEACEYFCDIEKYLGDWAHERLTKCDQCGAYFLPDMIEERQVPHSGLRYIKVCSDECFADYVDFHASEEPEISQHI